jgi:hypothetical protein
MTRATCANCGEQIEIKCLYSEYPSLDVHWRHTKTLYAWCHVTKAEPAVRFKDEPVCGDLL